jgi:peptidoglycan hydrolase-like protein with peptidoglycan-binding domain
LGISASRERRLQVGRRWIGAAATLAILGGAAVWFIAIRDGSANPGEADSTDLATATVGRRNLVESETFDGSLGFADERALMSGRTGTLTWIADEGTTLHPGDVAFEIDERPVVVMLGDVPVYRTLSLGVKGRDVRQLQRNLLALGFDDGGDLEVTGEFDSDTAEAVRDWQEDLGLERTGVVEFGDIAFTPSARRMGAHTLEVGSGIAPGAQVASTTSLERVVTLALEASDQDLVVKGDRVEVELPSGERVNGRISDVATVAETDPQDPDAEPTVEVSVRLLQRVSTELDEAPVDVDVETSRATNVLSVPVQALLALAEGGYAVEVVDSQSRTHLVGVETGTFADGFVEISGDGIVDGLDVVTAS